MYQGSRFPILVLIVLLAAFIFSSCGGQLQAGPKWWQAEARFFDDGIDLLADHTDLSGSFAEEQRGLLEARVKRADSIAVVEIESVQTIIDRQGRNGEYLSAEVVRLLHGQSPPDSLTLVSAEGVPGFGLLKRHQERLMGRHLLFLRLFERADGTLGQHFHLSPASEEMIELVEELTDELSGPRG